MRPVSVENRLAQIREARGTSAATLAAQAGVSRQTIYAIEAGSYVPNTAVALELARALGASVEELFRLENAPVSPAAAQDVALLAADPEVLPGQPVQLARVGAQTVGVAPSSVVWHLPLADGILLSPAESPHRKGRVELFGQPSEFVRRLLVAGCDPAMSVVARHAAKTGAELVLAHANSSEALALLKAGLVHIAGSHLRDDLTGESNLPAVKKLFPRGSAVVVRFAVWEEGLVVAPGNPKSILGFDDLARKKVRIVNREPGAGSRSLLDSGLRRAGIRTELVKGYESFARGHLPAAWQVRAGNADCCLATRAAARVFGLDFVPMTSERYDLVLRRRDLTLPAVEALLNTLNRAALRRELANLGQYDTTGAGKLME